MNQIQKGSILIANPHLADPHFTRSVILLCTHSNEESMGFIINHKTNYLISDMVTELPNCHLPIFEGGPVSLNSLYVLHQYADKISESTHIIDNIYWGGNFNDVIRLIQSGNFHPNAIKFFMGYSGWGKNQLNEEYNEQSWIVSDSSASFVFQTDEQKIWRETLLKLGGGYELLINAPVNPQLN